MATIKSKHRGLTFLERNPNIPWRVQIFIHNKNYYAGSFGDEEEAAKAYDNVAYYSNVAGRSHQVPLNFPEDYRGETPPPPNALTLRIMANVRARQVLRAPKSNTAREHLPEILAALKPAAELYAKFLAEYTARVPIDPNHQS